MSKELIAALEDIAATDEGRSGHKADRALHRHRSSVESVELPEGVRAAEARAVMNDDTIVYDATTVRSLIAAAVERATEEANRRANASWTLMVEKMVAIEREECAKVCDDQIERWTVDLARYCTSECAASIRSRGEMK